MLRPCEEGSLMAQIISNKLCCGCSHKRWKGKDRQHRYGNERKGSKYLVRTSALRTEVDFLKMLRTSCQDGRVGNIINSNHKEYN